MSKNGGALEYASEELKRNREVVLAAMKKSGRALQYASIFFFLFSSTGNICEYLIFVVLP